MEEQPNVKLNIKPMEIKTESGIAKPMPLSDIQQYNNSLNLLTMIIAIGIIVFVLLILFAFWYAKTYHVIAYLNRCK